MTDQVTESTDNMSEAERLLAEIKNSNGEPKYQNTEQALLALKNSQEHIPTIEEENKKLRADQQAALEKMNKLEEMLGALAQQQTKEESTATTAQESDKSGSQEVDMDAIFNQLQDKFSAQAEAKKKEANKVEALTSLKKAYGEKAGEVLATKAKELGVSETWLLDQASHSPQAFYNNVGLNSKPKQGSGLSQSSFNSTAFKPNPEGKKWEGKNPMLDGKMKNAVDFFQNYC